ncbi:hypothetical protein LEP1GSC084_0170 [Leptospira interrogans serovar Medanensis str. L0448]|nr:hypothetical protein LEP1GSC099_1058 [Leptospira interrogans str. UI 08452]EMF34357.1 hypothetical protein LEP1GSC201_1626 [Leptospira interrogans serovar Pomona str. Fox 32256]EMJ63630.1 hypothetical protein LEP1GSC197_2023 [Leptospira interrogans serovar Pomona str. CSL4002]EMN34970.1 hypothetical protein LEP1GSC084_0170 [Leptospira interrogans serovar Medanensis str. L0448]EMN42061.1 hypothetical protein LEP1GSC085_4794 [Leptospira interrogans str. L0996]EMN98721.1 hypothetical protein L
MIDIYVLNFIEISKTYIKSYKKENFKEADRSRSFWVASCLKFTLICIRCKGFILKK